MIVQVPLADGGTLEFHGYATHWTNDDVAVAYQPSGSHPAQPCTENHRRLQQLSGEIIDTMAEAK